MVLVLLFKTFLCQMQIMQTICALAILGPYKDAYERKRMDIPTPFHVLTRYQIILKISNDIKSSTL